jgi:hypothetical protein
MSLEDVVYSNVEIRNFLKLFSQQHWNRVCKATLLLGIRRLDELCLRFGEKGLTHLTADAIEEIVVASQNKMNARRHKKMNFDSSAKKVDSEKKAESPEAKETV